MPPPIPYKTVTGTYVSPGGTPIVGRLRFIPSDRVGDVTDNEIVPPTPIYVTFDVDGGFAVDLAVTDDPASSPVGWSWIVTELFAGGTEFEIQVPASGPSVVRIADLTPPVTDASTSYAAFTDVAALDARVTVVEASAAVTVAAVVVHPFLTMGV